MVFRAKVYRLFSAMFALVGLIVFVMVYDEIALGNFHILMQQPLEALALLVPFVPAIILSKMAVRNNEKIRDYNAKTRKRIKKRKKEKREAEEQRIKDQLENQKKSAKR